MTDHLPKDPFMLVSTINMLLRDGEFDSLEELCAFFDYKLDVMKEELKENGFEYNEDQKQIKVL
jgi:hypothetical protein